MQDLFFFLFLNLFLNSKLRAYLKRSQYSERNGGVDTVFSSLYLFQLLMDDVSWAGAPTWTFGISSAQRVSTVITGREDKAGSRACWGTLVSMKIIQALSPTWPYPSGCPLCTKVPDPGHTARA